MAEGLDPWFGMFMEHADFRFRLQQAVEQHELMTVAVLIGAVDEFPGIVALADPAQDDQAVFEAMVPVEDAITTKLVAALADEDGRVCYAYGVRCRPESHAAIAVTAMSSLLGLICTGWRPSMAESYANLVRMGVQQIQEQRLV